LRLSQTAAVNLDIAIFGQLSPAQLPLGDEFAPSTM
jgi:hypothetical protein